MFLARAEDQTFRMAYCKLIQTESGYVKECTIELNEKTKELKRVRDTSQFISDENTELRKELTESYSLIRKIDELEGLERKLSEENKQLQEKLTKEVKENEALKTKVAKAVLDHKDFCRIEKKLFDQLEEVHNKLVEEKESAAKGSQEAIELRTTAREAAEELQSKE